LLFDHVGGCSFGDDHIEYAVHEDSAAEQCEDKVEEDKEIEDYFFDPEEIEARILDEMYARYCPDIIYAKLREAASLGGN